MTSQQSADAFRVQVPEGESGAWRVERFTLSAHEAEISGLIAYLHGERGVPAGTYTRLMHGRHVVMSDTPKEMDDHGSMLHAARGNILILGLGLGMVLQACLDKKLHVLETGDGGQNISDEAVPVVDHATVVEIDPDVLALVGPYYQQKYGDRLTLVQADALTWQPPAGAHYTVVWCDIWADICTDNLPEYTRLKRRFARRADWVGCWAEAEVRRQQRRERRMGW